MLGLVLLNVWLGLAAQVNLGSNMWLDWTVSGSTITFDFGVASSLKQAKRWVGISFKDASGSRNMKDSDVIMFDFDNLDNIYDMWATRDELPDTDATNDVSTYYTHEVANGYYVFTFKRDLNTGDSMDYSLLNIDQVQIQWAYGPMSSNGDFLEHGKSSSELGAVVVYISDGSIVPSSQANYLLATVGLLLLLV
ncbi:hypothetical protein SteCoe_36718 [Stentor coeruleus]|uniref:DOMON domain-containing protein n=1 Tax=Stentor coeruleus TaxID=5963 RepID=A0A1R2APR7_9CILI|nr:hypothetical protein SteCoe_36718 [Stentor coeruleus]